MTEIPRVQNFNLGEYGDLLLAYIQKMQDQIDTQGDAIEKCKTSTSKSNTIFIGTVITILLFGFGLVIASIQNLNKEITTLKVTRSEMVDKVEKENKEMRNDLGILLNITYPDHQRLNGYKELWSKYFLNKK